MRFIWQILLFALLCGLAKAEDVAAVTAYILHPKDSIYGWRLADGLLDVPLSGRVRISWRGFDTVGLSLPVTIVGGQVGLRTAVWLVGEIAENDVTWYDTRDVEGVAEGKLTLENGEDLSLPWIGHLKVPKEGAYDAVLAVAFISHEGKKVVLHSGPIHFRVTVVANQSADPTLSSGTPPAGQESRHP
jgi:hypothetical protein